MKNLLSGVVLAASLMFQHQFASAETRYTKSIEGEFEDVIFDLQDAIVNEGLIVEHSGDIGQMLERTAKAVTGTEGPNSATYLNAKYLLFCSSKLTHKATAANPKNISICPFLVYAYETKADPGKVSVGYRNPDLGNINASDPLRIEIHTFLKQLIDTTAGE